jgi:23S rRNA (guanosine2251-2'-O)-methyltransferase
MKKNLKKRNNSFAKIEANQNTKEKKIFQPIKSLSKIKQIPLTGSHTILSALNNKNRKLHYLITTAENHSKWEEKIGKLKLKLNVIIKSKEEIDKINNYKPHQNAILVTEPLQRLTMDEFLSDERFKNKIPIRLILLDEVTDPQNVGAIIRSALAFKMDGLALSQRNSPQETSSLNKASSGALEKLQIIELSNMSREIKKLQMVNFSIYGLTGDGQKDVYDLENETGNVALILGSEGKGLRRLTKENVDSLIKIPISVESDSLNVSNAASVAMFQLQKNIIKN